MHTFFLILLILLVVILLIKPLLKNIFSLDFFPAALNMFNGNINSNAKFKYPEIFINYIFAAIINLIDFVLLAICWIPFIKAILNYFHRCPDLLEKHIPFLFGGSKGHRNFITHSIFNPIFLIYVFGISKACFLLPNTTMGIVFRALFFIIGLCFTCHLLADTMPKHWQGFSNIKLYLFINITTLPAIASKLWLYINSIVSVALLYNVIF